MRHVMRWMCLATLLAGCGQHAVTDAPTPASRPLPSPSVPVFQPDERARAEGERIQALLKQTFAMCRGVEGEVTNYSEGHFKSGKQVSDLRHATYRTRMLWAKPLKIRAEILETDNFLVGGARMVTQDCQRVRVRGAGILGILPLTLDATDDLLASNRNHRFTAMLPSQLINHLLAAKWLAQPGDNPHSVCVALEGGSHFDAEIDREAVWLDATDARLKRITMFAKGRMVVDYQFTSFKWNPTIQSDSFEI